MKVIIIAYKKGNIFMLWCDVIINFLVGMVTGILSSIITNVFIEKRIKAKDEHKKELLKSYLFFMRLERNFTTISCVDITDNLNYYRFLYRKNRELSYAFHKVDVGISNALRLSKEETKATFNFNSSDYFEFKMILERTI